MNLSPLERVLECEVPAWAWRSLSAPYYTPKHDERRRHRRVATNDPAFLRILEPYSVVRWIIRIADVSKSGMKLLIPTPLTPGMVVQVHVKNTSVLARVRHCSHADPEIAQDNLPYQAGVEIQHVF